ncbi:MAG TPA: hypothetical protein PKC98_04090 [Candidatus Melainabacteria bacterium]|nr:hypothetical protein [Candidatus Melainabacteria bacterium]
MAALAAAMTYRTTLARCAVANFLIASHGDVILLFTIIKNCVFLEPSMPNSNKNGKLIDQLFIAAPCKKPEEIPALPDKPAKTRSSFSK